MSIHVQNKVQKFYDSIMIKTARTAAIKKVSRLTVAKQIGGSTNFLSYTLLQSCFGVWGKHPENNLQGQGYQV